MPSPITIPHPNFLRMGLGGKTSRQFPSSKNQVRKTNQTPEFCVLHRLENPTDRGLVGTSK